ncbi:MAG: polysaccharide biosynthesis protein PslH [Acidimicrobiaceae bacterium]|jgi:glycosyltransferase involved in cell wall biosynthesis
MFLETLAAVTTVDVVILPVAGAATTDEWARERARRVTTVEPVSAADADRHVVLQMADATLRAQLERTVPLPEQARRVPPTLVDEAVRALQPASGTCPPIVLSVRYYLAPFGITLARKLGAARTVIDLDDDDESWLTETGQTEKADAVGRLARAWLGTVDAVTLASAIDAERVASRYELSCVATVPNTVHPPGGVVPAPGGSRVLYVGNLTYGPNVDAARTLALEVLPALRALRPDASVDLVGPHDNRCADLSLVDGVTVAGPVLDVTPWYASADVVVVPLRSGSGTRIKILEAFAHRRPVIATPSAAAGLDVRDGVDLLVASSVDAIARATADVLARPERGARLTSAAFDTFTAHYAPDVVAPIIRRTVFGDQVPAEGKS